MYVHHVCSSPWKWKRTSNPLELESCHVDIGNQPGSSARALDFFILHPECADITYKSHPAHLEQLLYLVVLHCVLTYPSLYVQ